MVCFTKSFRAEIENVEHSVIRTLNVIHAIWWVGENYLATCRNFRRQNTTHISMYVQWTFHFIPNEMEVLHFKREHVRLLLKLFQNVQVQVIWNFCTKPNWKWNALQFWSQSFGQLGEMQFEPEVSGNGWPVVTQVL